MIQEMPQSVRRPWPFALSLLCLFTVLPGMFLSFEDSEIWGITSSRRFVDDITVVSSAHFKPLFSAVFGTIVNLAPTDWSALVASRWIALAFTAGGLFSLYSIGILRLDERRSRPLTILMYALFTTVPLFLVHFPKARSDSIASSVVLIGIFVLLNLPRQASPVYFLTSLIALLITPKSVDLVAAMGVFYWMGSERPSLRKFSWIATPAASIFILGMLWGREPMARVMMYWIDSYRAENFFSAQNWSHVWLTVSSAPITLPLLLAGFGIGIASFKSRSSNEKAMLLSGALVLVFVLLHSQKFHFFLASRLPFVALAALPGLHTIADFLSDKWGLKEKRIALILIALVALSLSNTTLRLDNIGVFQMRRQKVVHEEFRQYILRTGVTRYWDGIGIFPKMNSLFHYPSPGDRGNSELIGYAEISKPLLVLRTSKMELLQPELFAWLNLNYVSLSTSVSTRISNFDRVNFTTNCEVSKFHLESLVKSSNLEMPVVLLVRTKSNPNWNQIPFSDANGVEYVFFTGSETLPFVFKDCKNLETSFALSSGNIWRASPAPSGLLLFGYNGRL